VQQPWQVVVEATIMVFQIGLTVVDTHRDQLFPRSEFALLMAICGPG
jgi:hypothetical protein